MTGPAIVETPLQTAWPALVAAALLLVGLVLAGRRLLPERRTAAGLGAILVVAAVVRLFVVPAWARHQFDGHEAEYWDIFRGVRALSRGGPVLYPAMQWFWAGAGAVLPADPRLPVLISTGFGVSAIAAVGAAVARLATPLAGLAAAAILALHPVHAAWSSSAYHVVHPHFFACLALLAAAAFVAPAHPGWPIDPPADPPADAGAASLRQELGLGLVLAASLALAVATRIEAGLLALPCVLLLALVRRPGSPSWRRRLLMLAPLAVGGILSLLAARPILFPGELPGSGDKAAAFAMNVDLLGYHAPFDTLPALALVVAGLLLAVRRWPVVTLVLAALAVGNHLLMSTFDDYGDRHTLPATWAIAWAIGAGAVSVPAEGRRLGMALVLGGVLVTASGLPDLHRTFYGPEEAFLATLQRPPFDGLPRHSPAQVPTTVAPPGQCGWIAEDHRVARDPPLSHFNLVDPAEAERHRGSDGCLKWCADVQDWRWSSRGVRDRALRLHHVYELRAVSVVEDADSGFACVVWQVGARRR